MVELPRKEAFESAKAETAKVAEMPAPAATEPVVAKTQKTSVRNLIKRGGLVAALLVGAAYGANFGYHYWTVGRFMESTDDAYVKADYTTIAPKVTGYIKEVLVNDNDTVKAGQVLARIDDRDFQAA